MASVNKVILVGNLGRDPESRSSGDTTITNITLATTHRYRDQQKGVQDDVEWHRIVFFGRVADIAANYLKKGSQAYVEGRLHTRKYTGKDGVERNQTEIVGETLQLLGNRATAGASQPVPYDSRPAVTSATASRKQDNDIPF